MRLLPALGSLLCVSFASACATSYTPEPGPRISVVMSGGMPAYHKNGKDYPHGFLGAGLVDAVSDDPQAREAAETYHERSVGGFIAVIGGLACGIAGVAVIGMGQDENGNVRDESVAIGGAALVCMLGASIAGLVLIATAEPYQWDAINTYNDHVDQRLRALRCSPPYCPPVWPPPYAPPTAPSRSSAPLPAAPPAPASAADAGTPQE